MVSLRRNSFWLLFARISAQGLAVVFIALVARKLTTASFGQFTFIAAVVLIGNTFTTFGTDTLLIREIAKAGHVTVLVARAFTLQIILSAIWCFVTILFRMDTALLIFSFSLFPLALFSIVSALLRAYERMDLFWGVSLINGLVQILGAAFSSDLLTLCTFLLIGNIITSFLALRILSILMPDFSLFSFLDFRPLLPMVLPFAVLTTLSVLAQRLGVLSVSLLVGDIAAGLFSSAARVVEGMKLGHFAVLGALLPALSRKAVNSIQSYRVALIGLIIISAFLAIVAMFFAQPILHLLFGEKYIIAENLLVVLVWSLIPYTISAFVSVDLVAHGREVVLLGATSISLVVSLVLCILLIKYYGLPGAAWAVLAGEIIQAIILIQTSGVFRTSEVSQETQ